MRSAVVAGFFFSAGIAWGAPPKGAINVHVEWINYDELHCEGCRAQTVTMDAGSFFITTHKREGKMIYTKIAGDWVGDAIRVTLTDEVRSDNGSFLDLKGDSAVVEKEETKVLKVGEIRLLVSAAKAEDKPSGGGKSVTVPGQHLSDRAFAWVTPPAGRESRFP
jgi:hypothetical protein